MAAQNLVPNPSFEDTVSCPIGPDQLSLAQFWYSPTFATTDYYHECSDPYPIGLVGVPFNWVGYQLPRTGNGYIGLVFDFGTLNPEYREYAQIKLLEKLKTGGIYKLSFYASLADSSALALSQLGGLLSENPVGTLGDPQIEMQPQVLSNKNTFLVNKDGWMEITGYFIAQGNEKYLTIGHFLSNANSSYIKVYDGLFANQSYYYIDDVSIEEISTTNFPNVFTPNNDGLNDEFDLKINCLDCGFELQIYNRWGQLLEQNNTFKWNGMYNGNSCSDGVYYYVLNDTVNKKAVYSGFFLLKAN